jgi:hypothetical protein
LGQGERRETLAQSVVTSCLLRHVREVKADGKLEIQLHSGALEATIEGVEHGDVDLRAVERSILWVFLQSKQIRE